MRNLDYDTYFLAFSCHGSGQDRRLSSLLTVQLHTGGIEQISVPPAFFGTSFFSRHGVKYGSPSIISDVTDHDVKSKKNMTRDAK